MASIRKRNNTFSVIYSYLDEHGKRRQKWETFKTLAEAKARKKEVDYKESIGTFVVPKCKIMDDLLDEFILLYGKNSWAVSTYRSNVALIDHYIRPKLGKIKITEINTRSLERYYQVLLKTQAVPSNFRKNKDTLLSPSVVRDVHKILRCCFGQARKWGLIEKNPAELAMVPKVESKKREIWESDTLFHALNVCDDPCLALAINLSFACSLRIGELLGLTWDCVVIDDDSIETGSAYLFVEKELQRVSRSVMETLEMKDIRLVFPIQTKKNSTVLVLKSPKTHSSVRKIFLPKAVALMLRAWKDKQEENKEYLGSEYRDFNLVFANGLGTPIEQSYLRKALNRLIKENDLPPIVFHSFRHASVTYKLKLSGGDIKAVQGDSGHSQVSMITDVYSHILDDDRRINAQRFQETFYEPKKPEPAPAPASASTMPEGLSPEMLSKLMEKPEVAALLMALTKTV